MENKNAKVVVTRKRTPKKPIAKLLSYLAIGLSIYLIYGVGMELMTTFELKQQLETVEQELAVIKEENTQLTSQKVKLEDPDYVQNYARGNYMLSKEGEQIFYLPGSSDDSEE